MVQQAWRAAVVRVWKNDPSSNSAEHLGSAFVISDSLLLTASHVVPELAEAHIFVMGPAWTQPHKVVRVARHPSRDIAILFLASSFDLLTEPVFPAIELSTDPIVVAGYTSATGALETANLSPKAFDGRVNTLVLHTFVGKGMSGGPALQNGRFIGVTQAREVDTSKTYIIEVSAFSDFVRSIAESHGLSWPPLDASKSLSIIQRLPSNFVPRDDISSRVVEALASARTDRVVALTGLGGIGKTTIALAVAHSPRIRGQFSDGVLWASVGTEPTFLPILQEWLSFFVDNASSFSSAKLASAQLKTVLRNRKALIVIDDIWSSEALDLLNVGGELCGSLITTRDTRAVSHLTAELIDVAELDALSAEQLILRRIAGVPITIDPLLLKELCRLLGYLPLGLNLSASILLEGMPLEMLTAELRKEIGRLKAIDLAETTRTRSVDASLNLSLERILPDEFQRLLLLSTLKAQELLDVQVASIMFDASEFVAQKTLSYLASKSLLSRSTEQTFKMHDLVRDKCRTILLGADSFRPQGFSPTTFKDLAALESWPRHCYVQRRHKSAGWRDLNAKGYTRRQLFYHLSRAHDLGSMLEVLTEDQPDVAAAPSNAWLAAHERAGGQAQFIVDNETTLSLARTILTAAMATSGTISENARQALSALFSCSCILSSVTARYSGVSLRLARALMAHGVWQPLEAVASIERSISPCELILFSFDLSDDIRLRLQYVAVRRLIWRLDSPIPTETERPSDQIAWASFLVSNDIRQAALKAILPIDNRGLRSFATTLPEQHASLARWLSFALEASRSDIDTPEFAIESAGDELVTAYVDYANKRSSLDCGTEAHWPFFKTMHSLCRAYVSKYRKKSAGLHRSTQRMFAEAYNSRPRRELAEKISNERLCLFADHLGSADREALAHDVVANIRRYWAIERDLAQAGFRARWLGYGDQARFSGSPDDSTAHLTKLGRISDASFLAQNHYEDLLHSLVEMSAATDIPLLDAAKACSEAGYERYFSMLCAVILDGNRRQLLDTQLRISNFFALASSCEDEELKKVAYVRACDVLDKADRETAKVEVAVIVERHLSRMPNWVKDRLSGYIADLPYSRQFAESLFAAYDDLPVSTQKALTTQAEEIGDYHGLFLLGVREAVTAGTSNDPNVVAKLIAIARSIPVKKDVPRLVLIMLGKLDKGSHLSRSLLEVALEASQGIDDEEQVSMSLARAASLIAGPGRDVILNATPIFADRPAVVIRTSERRAHVRQRLRELVSGLPVTNGNPSMLPDLPVEVPDIEKQLPAMPDAALVDHISNDLQTKVTYESRSIVFDSISRFAQELSIRGHSLVAQEAAITMHDCYRWWP